MYLRLLRSLCGRFGFALFSLAQPFYGWGIGQVELPARFIGLPIVLKLKRETKPDESGSGALVAALPAVNGWARETRR